MGRHAPSVAVLVAMVAAAGAAVAVARDVGAAGGTVITVAEYPNAAPSYIFPMLPPQFATVTTVSQFQILMYRPLYWAGDGSRAVPNWRLSVALPPRYEHGRRVVVTLKPYRWSDGERVTGLDVQFFLNLDKVAKESFAGYSPGTLPDDVTSVTARGGTVTLTLTHPVSSAWFTYNELGQITPLPLAWDVTSEGAAPGSAGCARASWSSIVVRSTKRGVEPVSAAARACAAVFAFLSREAGWDPANPTASKGADASYATNPLWQVVDGPWHLTAYRSDGFIAMKPNPSYSGPVKPTISEFDEVPFTSNEAQFNALAGGSLSVGRLPTADVTANARSATRAGPNNPRVADAYDASPLYWFGIGFLNYNFNSVGDGGEAGHLFRQLYLRQALQSLVDQPLYIRKLYKGYAVPVTGPVPVVPPNAFASRYERTNPYPYDPARAIALLRAHGWTVRPNAVSTCADATRCGVPAGTRLDLTVPYQAGDQVTDELMAALAASWAQAGIHVRVEPVALNSLVAQIQRCSGPHCTWEIGGAGGWIYGLYPSGELIFGTSSPINTGSYSDRTADRLIQRSITTDAGLTAYENYIAKQLPVLWLPWTPTILEVKKHLGGVDLNPFGAYTPESWRVR